MKVRIFYFFRPSVGFCEVDLVPLVVLPGELWSLLVAVHDRRVGRVRYLTVTRC